MAFSGPSRLTKLQQELLQAFFGYEHRFFLTGGAALAGFHVGHRTTEDLDLFAEPGADLDEGASLLRAAATQCGAELRPLRTYPDFRRFLATRADETCVVDLVVDRAPALEREKQLRGAVRIDSTREIVANKLCAVLGRAEPKDLVDLQALLARGEPLERALEDAARKDAGVDPASLAFVLESISIGPEARLPGEVDPVSLEGFRRELVKRLRALAFERATRG